jgi:hypothetical protein
MFAQLRKSATIGASRRTEMIALEKSARFAQQRLRQRLNGAGRVVKIKGFLSIEPEVRCGIKRRGELDRDCRCHLGPFVNDSVDHFEVTPNVIRQFFLGDV